MAKMFYSMASRNFYCDEVHGDRMPEDVTEISEEAHQALMAAQAAGKLIDWSGESPVPTDQPASTRWRVVQGRALRALEQSDGVAVRCLKAGKPYPKAWVTYDAALRAIVGAASGDPSAPLPERPDYPAGT